METLNIRAEFKLNRNLIQDLQDIQNCIEIRYDADLRKAGNEQKNIKYAETKVKNVQALEWKLLDVSYENQELYSLDLFLAAGSSIRLARGAAH